MTKLSKKIEGYSNQFKTIKRGEDNIVVFDNESSELHEAVYKAHGDRVPNDFIFSKFWEILQSLEGYEIHSIDDVEEYRGEIVGSCTDVYTSNLTEWLNSSVYNTDYLDEAVKEFGATDNILGTAQYMAIDEIYSEVVGLLTA